MLKIISTKKIDALESKALIYEQSYFALQKKYEFINQENRSLHKEKEKFNLLESDAVKSEQLKYADLLLKFEVAQAKAEKWDALKDKEAKKARDRRAKRKDEVVITLDPILEEFLELRGIKDEYIAACIYFDTESRFIESFAGGFLFKGSKENKKEEFFWDRHSLAFYEFLKKKGEQK